MKILYVSLHQVLEFDEIRILQNLGYEIFPLGVYFGGRAIQPFRPDILFPPSLDRLMSQFTQWGGRYQYGLPASEQVIPSKFVELFDIVLVMHDFDFLEQHWEALSVTKVIWRSIGVATQELEPRVLALRKRGCHVVRYCQTEQNAIGYAGHDAVIRFGKSIEVAEHKGDIPQILTFSQSFFDRFPQEYHFYSQAIAGFKNVLCGYGNDQLPGSIGVVDFEEQNKLLSHSAVYYYAGGTFIPYTLNFMEAWLSGIPIVATDCRAVYAPETCAFAEVPTLIKSGENGFLALTPEEAAGYFRSVINDPAMAREVGEKGALAARSYFSAEVVAPQWKRFLESIVDSARVPTTAFMAEQPESVSASKSPASVFGAVIDRLLHWKKFG